MVENALEVSAEHGLQTIDSLCANEFLLEIDGQEADGIFRITEFVSFKLDVKPTTSVQSIESPFKIVKMVQRDPNSPFNLWIRDTFKAGPDIQHPKRTLTVVAVDDGRPIRRWIVRDAWISEIRYSDFDTASGEMVEETVTVQYEKIEEQWPLLDADAEA